MDMEIRRTATQDFLGDRTDAATQASAAEGRNRILVRRKRKPHGRGGAKERGYRRNRLGKATGCVDAGEKQLGPSPYRKGYATGR